MSLFKADKISGVSVSDTGPKIIIERNGSFNFDNNTLRVDVNTKNVSINNITDANYKLTVDSIKSTRLTLPRWDNDSLRPSNPEAGTIGYNNSIKATEVYTGTEWIVFGGGPVPDLSAIGLSPGNPATSGMQLLNAGAASGLYWIQPSGQSSYQMYVDNTRNGGGWVLCSNVRTSTCQEHITNSFVRITGTDGPRTTNTSTTQMSQGWIQALRTGSTYTGSTAYWLEALNFNKNMFVSTSATVDLVSSASSNDPRTNVTLTYEGALSNRDPNTGTRGFGDHHTSGGTYFAWGRHPEEGNNCGFREDGLGASNGYLWVK